MRTRTISDDTIREVQRRVDSGATVQQGCKGLGLTPASYYARRRSLQPAEPAPNGCCAPDTDLTVANLEKSLARLERLCGAQATLLAKHGITVLVD